MDRVFAIAAVAIIALCLLFLAFYAYDASAVLPGQYPVHDFDVQYYASHTSSGGDRVLDVRYEVRGGQITSCSGTYAYPGEERGSQSVEQCNVQKLKSSQYNVPLELFTELSAGQKMYDAVADGPSSYRYTIFLRN